MAANDDSEDHAYSNATTTLTLAIIYLVEFLISDGCMSTYFLNTSEKRVSSVGVNDIPTSFFF